MFLQNRRGRSAGNTENEMKRVSILIFIILVSAGIMYAASSETLVFGETSRDSSVELYLKPEGSFSYEFGFTSSSDICSNSSAPLVKRSPFAALSSCFFINPKSNAVTVAKTTMNSVRIAYRLYGIVRRKS